MGAIADNCHEHHMNGAQKCQFSYAEGVVSFAIRFVNAIAPPVDHLAFAGRRTLAEVRDAVGHANISITSAYLHVAVEDDGVEVVWLNE
jgi:hypothetical protein